MLITLADRDNGYLATDVWIIWIVWIPNQYKHQ